MELALAARHVSLSVSVKEASGVSEARRLATKLAEALEFGEADVGRVAQVVTEAATNIVQHAERGELLLRSNSVEAQASLEILALDQGPGIANVAHAQRDGFSTSGSSGLGLGAIARLSTFFEISSARGKGTALLARICRAAPIRPMEPGPPGSSDSDKTPSGLEWGAVCVPKRDEKACGDAWAVMAGPGRTTVLIVDGLGHGLAASTAAQQALRAFREHAGEGPESNLKALHEALRQTRGAVAGVAEIDWRRREVRYAGAGNIAGMLGPLKGRASNLVSHNGTLGEKVAHFQEFTYTWPEHGLLVLWSDGLSGQWDLEPYPGLKRKDPSLIAGVLYRDFASRKDDVVVLVGREGGGPA